MRKADMGTHVLNIEAKCGVVLVDVSVLVCGTGRRVCRDRAGGERRCLVRTNTDIDSSLGNARMYSFID